MPAPDEIAIPSEELVESEPDSYADPVSLAPLPDLEGHVRPAPGTQARRQRQESQVTKPIKPLKEVLTEEQLQEDTSPMRPLRRRKMRNSRQPVTDRESQRRDRVRPRGVVWLSWRWVSGTISASLVIVLILMLSSDAFYVSTVAVGGVNYLSREEVFRYSGISQKHIFWVDPEAVVDQLEANNSISAADVRIGWGAPLVQIVVRERNPAIIWEQGDNRVWVDLNGHVMFQRIDRPDLLRIVYDPSIEEASQVVIGPSTRIEPEIIQGGLLLRSQLTNIDILLYHPIKGLGWRDPRGWMAWFGLGDNMVMKATVYEALVNYNIDALQFGEIDVSDPDNPVYTVLWRKGNTAE